MVRLGVNIDHVATIRQARRTVEPDPVAVAIMAELAGADGITVHLREDRRHIQDRDVEVLRQTVRTRLNLEMAGTPEMVRIASRILPDQATLVPERRQEVTTEGGLDAAGDLDRIRATVAALKEKGITVSLFIDPEIRQVAAAREAGADQVELHTGQYAAVTLRPGARDTTALARLETAGAEALVLGLALAAGHGLTYWNVAPVARIPGMEELNIGHCIVSRAVLVGFERAVKEMKAIIDLH
jgi:pyridoxine 5-phosphate synthase